MADRRFILPLILAASAAAAPAARAAILTADGVDCTLGEAIVSANLDIASPGCVTASGDDVIVLDYDVTLTAPDLFDPSGADGTRAGLPAISSNVVVRAGAGRVVRRDPSFGCSQNDPNQFRLFRVESGHLELEGLELRHGCAAPADGATLIAAGGAIHVGAGALLTLDGCVLEDNVARGAVGMILGVAAPAAPAYGGAVYLGGAPGTEATATIVGSELIDNRALGYGSSGAAGAASGGALHVGNASFATVTGSVFAGNRATGGDGQDGAGAANGGAIALGGDGSFLSAVLGTVFRANRAEGGAWQVGSTAEGGAIGSAGGGTFEELRGSIFEANVAQGGFGDSSGGTARGGAISCISSCLLQTIEDVLFAGNQALGGASSLAAGHARGGAIGFAHIVGAANVTLVGNLARGGDGAEGGHAHGGAVRFETCDGAPFDNVTAHDNTARGGDATVADQGGEAEGGGFSVDCDLILRSATVAGNRAIGGADPGGGGPGAGGGIAISDVSPTFGDLALSGNTVAADGGSESPNDCDLGIGSITSLGANVVASAGTCAADLGAGSDQVGVDPLILPLGDYGCVEPLPEGGCLPTMALDLASTAIDRGDCSGLGIRDARGFAREIDRDAGAGTCDSGAYEMQRVIHVDADASGANDGSSWTDAFVTLRDGLATLLELPQGLAGALGSTQSELWIAEGVYRPDVGDGAVDDDPAETFTVPSDGTLFGGFAGGETAISDRDPAAHPTVLSGDIDVNDTVDGDGVTGHWQDIAGTNALHVVSVSGTPDGALIFDGLVITGGAAVGGSPHDRGAAIHCPTGGALTLRGVEVIGNEMADRAALFGCEIEASDSRIVANHAGDVGAVTAGTAARFVRSELIDNRAEIQASLFYQDNVPLTLIDVVARGNAASGVRGAIHIRNRLEMTNVAFSGSSVGNGGAVLYLFGDGDATLDNVTVSGSRGNDDGAILFQSSGHLAIRNSIFWNNRVGSTTGSLPASIDDAGNGRIEIRNSLVQGSGGSGGWIPDWIDGGGNLDADPLFVEDVDPATAPTGAGDLRLRLASPAIDAGDSALVTVAADLAGVARVQGPAVDLGPWELPGEIFSDGFESGDVCAWSAALGDTGPSC